MTIYPTKYPFVKVLDKGFVALLDHKGSDLTVARAARVQPEAEWRPDLGDGKANDEKLIKFMRKNFHNTPFEKVNFSFWVKAPIFVYRQWHRHRTWSYNEQSARYQVMAEEFYYPDPTLIGSQSKSNHQSRIVPTPEEDMGTRIEDVDCIRIHCEESHHLYKELLISGWPRELARMVLPVNLYSQMEADVNLHNLLNFFSLRLDEHAQYEIRVYAQAMYDLVKPIVPVCIQAWEETKQK